MAASARSILPFALLLMFVAVPVCAADVPPPDRAPPDRAVPKQARPRKPSLMACSRLFEPPKGARPLCEHTARGRDADTLTRRWATTEPRVSVNARYRDAGMACRFGVVTKPPVFAVLSAGRELSTFDVTDAEAAACTTTPGPDDQTVIVITQRIEHTKTTP
jgi:hypothetical protein